MSNAGQVHERVFGRQGRGECRWIKRIALHDFRASWNLALAARTSKDADVMASRDELGRKRPPEVTRASAEEYRRRFHRHSYYGASAAPGCGIQEVVVFVLGSAR